MRQEIESPTEEWENLCALAGPQGTLLLGLERPANRRFSGRYLDDVARELGKDWIETAFDLVREERQEIATVFFVASEENVEMLIDQPWMKLGTDAGGRDPDAPGGLAHPRAYGTFTRVLGHYVREEGVTDLEDAVRKMSSAVATRLNLEDRGLVKEGYYADVLVFDPLTVADRATYEAPHRVSTGIEHVFVNGVAVLSDGRHTGAMPGRPLRGPGWTGRE